MRNFRELSIWKEAMGISKEVYLIAAKLPNNEKFGLRSQITRASVSVPSNIAEGCAKSSEKEFKWYLEVALGSLFELETQLVLINELKLIPDLDFTQLLEKINVLQRMMNNFISAIKKRTAQFPKPNT